MSMASNEQEIVDRLKEIDKVEMGKWDREWNSESNTRMSLKDQRYVDISILEHLLNILSNKGA